MTKNGIKITSLRKCIENNQAKQFINRWMDTTRSTLLFSKGNILVEGLAEALLIPKLAEIYLGKLELNNVPKSLEEAGISVINMNGILFQYFMKLYDGYELIYPEQEDDESKEAYKERIDLFRKRDEFEENEYKKTDFIPILCATITDSDPEEDGPKKNETVEGKNPQLFLKEQVKNMTNNCRIYTNLKTFEYDLAMEKDNAKKMIEIILNELPTNGPVRDRMNGYLGAYQNNEYVEQSEIAFNILKQIDASYLGKGLFAQLLLEKINMTNDFIIPDYIKAAVRFVLEIVEENDGK